MFVTFSRKSWNLNDVRNPKEPRWNAITGGQLNCGGKKYNFKYGLAYLQSVYMWSEVWNDQLGMHPSPLSSPTPELTMIIQISKRPYGW